MRRINRKQVNYKPLWDKKQGGINKMNIKTTKHCLICTLNITRGHKVYFIADDLERAYKRASELLGGVSC